MIGHAACANGLATFADGEALVFFHRDGAMSSTSIETLSPGITISTPCGERDRAGHVRGAEIELRAVVREERRVTATLVLRQNVDFGLEFLVRLDRAGLGDNLAALDVVPS